MFIEKIRILNNLIGRNSVSSARRLIPPVVEAAIMREFVFSYRLIENKNRNIPGLVESLKIDSTIAVTSSSLIGLKASILLGEKSSKVQTFLTFT